ncbi:MAG TPA: hypothetical protein VF765_30040 [Polyangiaceae bacterium]
MSLVVGAYGCSSKQSPSGFDAPGSSSSSGGGSGSDSGTSNGSGSSSGGGGSGDSGYGGFGDASYMPPPQEAGIGCTNLQCQVHSCSNGGSTTISGKVMDPAGHNPLYNVVVYIPNSQGAVLDPIPVGINSDSCSCGALFSGEPMAIALTQADGTFTIKNAPDGANIPLVVQIGKWRKEITIKNVTQCTDNPQGNIPLPKSHTDGMYASIPNIAVSTGGADTLECLLTRVGIDEAEFSGDPNTGSARVHIFQGSGGACAAANPASPSSSSSLWDSDQDLERYDITMLSCEGAPTMGANPQTLSDYVGKGGRVFAEHYQYAFFANQSQFANTADWSQAGGGPLGGDSYPGPITGQVQTTLQNGNPFPEGQALQTWLQNVGAAQNGSLPITVARHDALVGSGNVSAVWVQAASGTSPMSSQYFSWDMPFNAPVNDAGVPQYCGRVVFSDLHVAGANMGSGCGMNSTEDFTSSTVVPTGCANTQTLSADEDAIEFILFDLSSCITPVGYPPKPPQPPPEAGTAQ